MRAFFVSAWAEHAVAAVAAASAAATGAAVLFWLAELIERTARAVVRRCKLNPIEPQVVSA